MLKALISLASALLNFALVAMAFYYAIWRSEYAHATFLLVLSMDIPARSKKALGI